MLFRNTHHHGHTEQCRVLCRQEAAWRCHTDDRWPQLVDAVAGMLQEGDLRVEMNLTKIEVWTEGRGWGSPGDFPGDFPGESPIFMCPGLTVGRLWVMRLQGPRQGRPVASVWLWGNWLTGVDEFNNRLFGVIEVNNRLFGVIEVNNQLLGLLKLTIS